MQAVIILTLLWQCCCWVPIVNAADADVLWRQAILMAKQGQMDLAFNNFHTIVDSYPDFKRTPAAQFDVGEYYFLQKDLELAIPEFEKLSSQYPKKQESIIALAYLYKIAQMQGHVQTMDHYQKKLIASHRFVLLFKDSKSLDYLSGFQHKHKVVFYINKIEVFVDGNLFVTVPG